MLRIIRFDATTEELEKALPFTKGKWKPINMPLYNKEDIKQGKILEFKDEWRWQIAIPKTK